VSDWVRPAQAVASRNAVETGAAQRHASVGAAAKPLPGALPGAPLQAQAAAKPVPTKPRRAMGLPVDEVFEVPAEEMDLAQLAELAKKVVERKPP
jgi:hypothetical protein